MKIKMSLIIFTLIAILFTSTIRPVGETPGQANNKLIRLHVLANSDSQQDQFLKHKVKDAILQDIGYKFSKSEDINETREILLGNLDEVERVVKSTLAELGSHYGVNAQYGIFHFPTKYYGNFSLPAGKYEAVKVVIGEGQGANWWCVLFPPLCFVETKENDQQTNQLENGYPVNAPDRIKKTKIKVSFKIVDWVKESFPTLAKIFS